MKSRSHIWKPTIVVAVGVLLVAAAFILRDGAPYTAMRVMGAFGCAVVVVGISIAIEEIYLRRKK